MLSVACCSLDAAVVVDAAGVAVVVLGLFFFLMLLLVWGIIFSLALCCVCG